MEEGWGVRAGGFRARSEGCRGRRAEDAVRLSSAFALFPLHELRDETDVWGTGGSERTKSEIEEELSLLGEIPLRRSLTWAYARLRLQLFLRSGESVKGALARREGNERTDERDKRGRW